MTLNNDTELAKTREKLVKLERRYEELCRKGTRWLSRSARA